MEDIEALNEVELKKYNEKIIEQKLPKGTPYLKDVFGNIKISGRKPCEQPFQRLMVLYEGKVVCAVMIGEQNIQ